MCQNRLAHVFNNLEETSQRLEICLDDFPCTETEESYRPVNWQREIVVLERLRRRFRRPTVYELLPNSCDLFVALTTASITVP